MKPVYEKQVTIALNTSTDQGVIALSGFDGKSGSRRTCTPFSNIYIEGSQPPEPFAPTNELIGKHILYRDDLYEHIYLNQGTFTWDCLAGTEKGLAKTSLAGC